MRSVVRSTTFLDNFIWRMTKLEKIEKRFERRYQEIIQKLKELDEKEREMKEEFRENEEMLKRETEERRRRKRKKKRGEEKEFREKEEKEKLEKNKRSWKVTLKSSSDIIEKDSVKGDCKIWITSSISNYESNLYLKLLII